MYKLLISIVITMLFGLVAYHYKVVADEQERVKNIYLGNNQLLLKKIQKVYDDKLATDLRNKELEEKAKEDKTFDWSVDISSSPVVLELKK